MIKYMMKYKLYMNTMNKNGINITKIKKRILYNNFTMHYDIIYKIVFLHSLISSEMCDNRRSR